MLKKFLSKKKIFISIIALLIIAVSGMYIKSFGMKNYEKVDFSTGLVTASVLNVRQGPSLSYNIIAKVYKNQYIRVFAKIDKWYVIQTENDIIGVVHTDYVKPIYPGQENNETINETIEEKKEEQEQIQNVQESDKTNSSELTEDEKEILELINTERRNAGLDELQIDDELQNVARIKAADMIEKSYFSHTSPIYGSPFDMIKSYQITYKTAGENIAGNSNNKKAVEAWMNSEGHKENILNKSYNYTGIAVVKSPKYGKIYVQMFIGR